jgi:ferredoxin
MRILVDGNLCQGHGRCYEIAPEIFTDDVDGHSVLTTGEVWGDSYERAAEAGRACPERAISFVETPD